MIDHIKKYIFKYSKAIKAHALGWFLFILYDAVLPGVIKGYFGSLQNYLIHYSINIALFYFSAKKVLPAVFRYPNHSFWKLPIFIAITLASYVSIMFCIDSILVEYNDVLPKTQLHFNKLFIISYAWRGLYFILFSIGYYFFFNYVKERNKKEEAIFEQNAMIMEREIHDKKLAQAKNAFLLAQINPHFLFNTLNYIYYIVTRNAEDGANSITLLSKIMRYTADIENASDFVELAKEIDYVETLTQLHKLRLKEKLHFQFSYHEEAKFIQVIPLLLITIVENTFKHADITDYNCPAVIEMGIDPQNNLFITSRNKSKALQVPAGLNSGLQNFHDRLQLAYMGKASLNYQTDLAGHFTLELLIPEDALQNTNSSLLNKV